MISIPTQERYPKPVTLRPSFAKTWTKCSMAPWLLKKNERIIPKPADEKWTQEGTDAHNRAANHLLGLQTLKDKHDPVWTYVKDVERAQTDDSTLLVEAQSPTFYDPDYQGTVDAALIHLDGTRLDIWDLKYGMGQEVSAKGNPQMMIYWRSLYDFLTSTGLMEHMEMNTPVSLTIVQPRHWNALKIDTWETTVGEIMELTDIMTLEAEKIYKQRGLEFSPDEDTCRFCPARAVCIKRHEWELEHLPELEGDIPVMDLTLLMELYERRKSIKAWLDQIEKYVKDDVSVDGPISEFYEWRDGKRKGNTQWVDEKQALRKLRSRFESLAPSTFYKKSFLSPNQVIAMVLDETGEAIDKEELEKLGLTFRPPGKKVIARREFGTLSSKEEALEALRTFQES